METYSRAHLVRPDFIRLSERGKIHS